MRDPTERATGAARHAQPTGSTHFRVRAFDARGERQRRYLELIQSKSLVFGLGAAGSGKTFLAVAVGVARVARGRVPQARDHAAGGRGGREARLPAGRPARPSSIPTCGRCTTRSGPCSTSRTSTRLEEVGVIEVAPLAYMRGRTLSQRVRDPRRSPEHDRAADEDVPHAPRRGLAHGASPATRRRPTSSRGHAAAWSTPSRACRVSTTSASSSSRPTTSKRHALVAQIVRAYEVPSKLDGRGRRAKERDLSVTVAWAPV
jgi:hypothetical protein